MANYANLKAAIQNVVKTNGNEEITGALLQQSLLAIINALGAGYQYAGVAMPTTNPGTPDQNVFYFAYVSGTYSNFGGAVLESEFAILSYNGTWQKSRFGYNSTRNVLKQVYANATFTDNSITFVGKLYVQEFQSNSLVEVDVAGRTFTLTSPQRLVLHLDNTVSVVSGVSDIVRSDIVLLGISATSGRFGWGALFPLYIDWFVRNELDFDFTPSLYKQVFALATFTGNSVTFSGNMSVQRSDGQTAQLINVDGQTFTLSGAQRLVLHENNTVGVVANAAAVLPSDIVLLGLSTSLGRFAWGALFPLFESYGEQKTIYPELEFGPLSNANGQFGATWYGKQYVRVSKYIKLPPIFYMKASQSVDYRIFGYDKDFGFLFVSDWASISANTAALIKPEQSAIYYRFSFRKNSSLPDLSLFNFEITANINGEYEFYNVRPSNGYQHLTITVNAANCGSTNTQTASVQDSESLYPDYGLLALPQQYRNTGKPTRLIIYCHGSDTHYNSSTNQWTGQSLNPAYFLACGYAVMDIDGEIFYHNTTYKHNYSIQGVQSYINAYEWVIKNYNICKDGVFLGGRSMGANQVINLLYKTKIPVIAACSLAPGVTPLHALNFAGASQRQYTAQKMGMVGTEPTWTSNNPMTAAELAYFKSNWQKLYMWAPIFGIIQNLPDKDIMLADGMNYATSTTTPPDAEKTVYDSLIAKLRAPLKIFVANNDPTNPPACCSDYLFRMLTNGGSYVEERKLPAGGHFPEYATSQMVSYKDTYGNTLSNVPVVYIEMLQFWRRYEKWQ